MLLAECMNDDCGWCGELNDAVHSKHDPDLVCCPECHELVIPYEQPDGD